MKTIEGRESIYIERFPYKLTIRLVWVILISILLFGILFYGNFIKEEINEIDCWSDI